MRRTKDEARHRFGLSERRGLYRAIYSRRDIRAQFRPDPVPAALLVRLLRAAHHAGSVGFMQPWNFVVVRDLDIRRAIHTAFLQERERAAGLYEEPQRSHFLSLKLEGILEAPLNLCVTCDPERGGRMSWVGAPFARPICSAPAVPSKTSGWRRALKGSGWAGSAFCSHRSLRRSLASRGGSSLWPTCALDS